MISVIADPRFDESENRQVISKVGGGQYRAVSGRHALLDQPSGKDGAKSDGSLGLCSEGATGTQTD
ncbi:MAG: hypothetical protein JRN72_04770 [Nitrososphaerota archaeon]|jgi:hypothetical protein|nr:hypothetical protein [Nitrososphaerota archaeon]